MRENWAVVALFTLCIVVGFELRFIHGATDASDSEFLLLLRIFFTFSPLLIDFKLIGLFKVSIFFVYPSILFCFHSLPISPNFQSLGNGFSPNLKSF